MGFDFIYALAKHYYHLWYYNTGVWQQTTWMGVQTYKSPMDMWNYQEILVSLQPSVIIEFGTWHGGSALFFSSVMQQIGRPYVVVSVDITASRISEKTKADPNIQLLTMSSASA
jgi:cephalosporin hydroxylase